MRIASVLPMVALWAITVAQPGVAAGSEPALVVDDDAAECPHARFHSIQQAVDRARAGAVIEVCPGRYAEQVAVDKPVEIQGTARPIDELDCIAPILPTLSADRYAVVEPPSGPAFALVADNVDVSGFVLRGLPIGITTDDAHSGYRIHDNLLAGNTIGITFGSGANADSRELSRIDHNCFRDNSWAVADGTLTEATTLNHARIDSNTTFRTTQRAYEATHAPVAVVFDHNESVLDTNAYLISGSSASRIGENVIDRAPVGIEIGRIAPNEGLLIDANVLIGDGGTKAATAIGFNPPASGHRNRGIVVSGNSITAYRNGIVIGGPPTVGRGSLEDSEIVGNTITNSAQRAIRMQALNTRITVRDNTLNANGWHGIHAVCGLLPGTTVEVCPTDNTFASNELLGNGYTLGTSGYDARDDTGISPDGTLRPLGNAWIGNRCVTDLPTGQLCADG